MNLRPLLLAGIFLSSLLVMVPEPVRADVDLSPGIIANGGMNPAVDSKNDTTAIVHRLNSTNAVVLTYSTDAGQTWTDKSVDGTFQNYASAEVVVFNSTSFGVFLPPTTYTNTACTSIGTPATFKKTLDGGNTWATYNLPALNTDSSARQCYPSSSEMDFDVATDGTMYATYNSRCEQGSGGCGGGLQSEDSIGPVRSTDGGQTWTNLGAVSCSSGSVNGCSGLYSGMAVHATNATLFELYWVQSSAVRRYSATGGNVAINDPFVPLTTYGFGLTVDKSNGNTLGFHQGSATGPAYVGVQQTGNNGNTWYFGQIAATSNSTEIRAAYTTNGGNGALALTTGGNPVEYYESGDGAALSFSNLEVAGTAFDVNPGVYGNCNRLVIAYRDPSLNRLAITHRGLDAAENCTVVASAPSGAGQIWCSSLGETNGGFDFVEGTQTYTSTVVVSNGIDSGYVFDGDSTNFDYLGKSWGGVGANATGTTAALVVFQIEARTEGHESVFRVALSNHSATGTTSAPVMNKGSGAGSAGINSGDFADHVEAEFTEDGNTWAIKLWYVSGGGTRTRIGGTWSGGDPNSPTTYQFIASTAEGARYVAVRDASGDDLTLGGAPFNYTIPAAFNSLAWREYWFVGYGTSATFNAQTNLNDPSLNSQNYSTCVFDLVGTVSGMAGGGSNGNPGAAGSGVNPPPDQDDIVDNATAEPGPLNEAGTGFARLVGLPDAAGGVYVAMLLVFVFGAIGAAALANFKLAMWGFVTGAIAGLVMGWRGDAIDTTTMFVSTLLMVGLGAVLVARR